MKKLIIVLSILFFSIKSNSQVFVDGAIGIATSIKPAGIINIGYNTKLGEFGTTATYPKMMGIYYGYRLNAVTPYIGYGTLGLFGGLKSNYYNNVCFDLRVRKDIVMLTFGYNFQFNKKKHI
jgi:hypothetical protein